MLRFPSRLTWDLNRVRIAQALFGAARRPLALRIDLADFPASNPKQTGSTAGNSAAQSASSRESQVLALARSASAPLIWIGGDTPLHYPNIGLLTREIADLGRTVFVEIDGSLLRRRIHEFRPVSRLYLVLPLHGLEQSHDARVGRNGDFRATLESIRTARLSGFHICVLTTIFGDSNFSELHELPELISRLKVDGWIQTSPLDAPQAPGQSLEIARDLINDQRWRNFSRVLSNGAPYITPVRNTSSSEKDASCGSMIEAHASQHIKGSHQDVGAPRNGHGPVRDNNPLSHRVPEPTSTPDEGLPAL
jgi:hypothetical protein